MMPRFPEHQSPQAGTLRITHRAVASRDDVVRILDEARGEGWICTTDRVRRVPGTTPGTGLPLSAEIALGDASAMHLRHDGNEWHVWTMEETLGEGEHLAFDETYLSTEAGARLRYRTWWRLEQEHDLQVWRPFASRFMAWED